MRLILPAVLALAAALPAAAQDTLRFKDPKRQELQVEVGNLNYKIVEYDIDAGGNKQKTSTEAKDISEIVIDTNRMTFEFSQGVNFMNNGNFADAVERFEKVRGDRRAPELQRQASAINIVKCFWGSGDVAGTLRAVGALRQEKADSFFLMESYQYEIRAHLSKGDLNAANKSVQALEERGKSDGMPEWAKSADVLRGGLFELQGKWREALATHNKYARDKDVGEEATLGQLRCLKEIGDWAGLSARADAVLSENKAKKRANPRLMTAAFNARGEAKLNGKKPKDALLDFMQGVEVLNKGGESSREHETALARAAVACAAYATELADKTQKDLYKGRAQELLAQLDGMYEKSSHRAEVQKAIQAVK